MKLDWFRTHKNFVYYLLAPIVIVSFVFVFPSNKDKGAHIGGVGPSAQLTILGQKKVLTPEEVITIRSNLAALMRANDVSSDQAATHAVKFQTAQALGFEVGDAEMQEVLRNAVKQQIRMRESDSGDIKATDEHYHKLLTNMGVSAGQFERLIHELSVTQKYESAVKLPMVTDGKLLMDYKHDKEVVRLRFKTFKSEDYMAQTKVPTDDKIKEFYTKTKDMEEKNKDQQIIKQLYPFLLTETTVAGEILYFNTDKFFAEIKATDDDLKKYYDLHKSIIARKDPPKAGEKPYAPGEELKTFDEMKKDVEEKWLTEQKRTRASTRMTVLKTELETAEKTWKEEQAKKPEAEQKPFDIAAWAKTKDLVYWTTKEQTQDVYDKGKREVNAPDAGWIKDRFVYTQVFPQGDFYAPQRAQFSYPELADLTKPDSGWVMSRIKSFTQPKIKTLEEAKDKIIDHLKVEEATDLADKEAKKLHDDWDDGKNLPAIDTLDEVSGDSKSQHDLVRMFFNSPKAVGHVLDIARGAAETKGPKDHNEHTRIYVGFPVERLTPTAVTFEKDTEYDRDQQRNQVGAAEYGYIQTAFDRDIRTRGVFVQKGVSEPKLGDIFQQSHR
jgi:hypothetical protein